MQNNQNKTWGIVAGVVVIVLIIIGIVYAYNDDKESAMTDQSTTQENADVNAGGQNTDVSGNTNTNSGSSAKKFAPVITTLTPSQGKAGSEVSISGYGFLSTNNVIKFSSFAINTVRSADGNHLIFKVPESLRVCNSSNVCDSNAVQIEPGSYSIMVTNANGSSNVVSFVVTQSAQSN